MTAKTQIKLSRENAVVWACFDALFYASANPHVSGIVNPDALMEHYLQEGAQSGFSPNRWFDEIYYRSRTADVEASIREGIFLSGFEHYCAIGYPSCSPHWLFDSDTYRVCNPTLTEPTLKQSGFVNGYDHYLKFGAFEGRCGHEFFDPSIYSSHLNATQATECKNLGAYAHFLTQVWNCGMDECNEPQASAKFDPSWYFATYSDVRDQVRTGRWHSALHHYLVRGRHDNFLPRPPESHPVANERRDQTVDVSQNFKINIDQPAINQGTALEPIMGNLDIVGWAAANYRLTAVDVFIDEQFCGRAHHGIRTQGVAATFPQFAHGLFAGFRFVGSCPVEEGRHRVRVVARDSRGQEESESFDAEFRVKPQRDGPWSIRRRMRRNEVDFKLNLLRNAACAPVFIVLIGTDSGSVEAMHRTMTSVERQVYPHWHILESPYQPPSASAGQQNWLIPLGPGDELGVDALLELALHILVAPTADFIYFDDRRVDPTTGQIAPFFKPDWSPDLLLSSNYIGGAWTATAELIGRSGLSWSTLADADDFDRALRLTEAAACIAHAPFVLCEYAPPRNAERSIVPEALIDAMSRRNVRAVIENGRLPNTWRIHRELPTFPTVSIIIPTVGARGLIEKAIQSLREYTNYPLIELIVVDTLPASTAAPWRESVYAAANRVLKDDIPFNWSRVNNRAAAVARGEMLLFLNDDVAFTHSDWLRSMVEECQRPEVGVVGAQLLYPDGNVQHAGIFLTANGGRHAFHGLPGTDPGPFGLALTQRNVSAVTGACLMVRREAFSRLGGFDERFDTICNDVDFCQRALKAGLLIVYTPYATLTHYESVSRAELPEAQNESFIAEYWASLGCHSDPYFNCNLSRIHSDYRVEAEFTEFVHAPRPLADRTTVRRILAIKLDRLGDFVLSLPALRCVKERFAHAELTLLAAPSVCQLAALEPAIHETIAVDVFQAGAAIDVNDSALAELSTRLRRKHFDLAIDLRCHAETRPLLQASGATWLAGFDKSFEFPWLDIVAIAEPDLDRKAKRSHMADTLLDFAEKISACFDHPRAAFQVGPRPLWPASLPHPPPTQIRIAVHPGAGSLLKLWPAAHFATLIDELVETLDYGFVIVGAADERVIASEIVSGVRRVSHLVSLVGMTGPDELAAVISQCDLFIGNDSGPHHLAASLGVPTIGIHSGVVDAREWGPVGSSAVAVRRQMYCSPCYISDANHCPRALACLTELTPSRVISHIRMMLGGRQPGSGHGVHSISQEA